MLYRPFRSKIVKVRIETKRCLQYFDLMFVNLKNNYIRLIYNTFNQSIFGNAQPMFWKRNSQLWNLQTNVEK